MILDSNLTFIRGTDSPVMTTAAIPLGQSDPEGNTKGIGAYVNLLLHVTAAEDIPSLGITVQTADVEAGPWDTVMSYPARTGIIAGDELVNDRLPWTTRNWMRLVFTAAAHVNAHLALDTDKQFPVV